MLLSVRRSALPLFEVSSTKKANACGARRTYVFSSTDILIIGGLNGVPVTHESNLYVPAKVRAKTFEAKSEENL
jgi:hypothetical protein